MFATLFQRFRSGSTAFLALIISYLLSHTACAQAESATQQISLHAGWNLVSLQVGNAPVPVATFSSALSTPNNLIEIWGYQPSGSISTPGQWKSFQPKLAGYPSDLPTLSQGKGYWVNVSQATTLSLEDVPWDGTLTLQPGWNLVGFPGLSRDASEVQELSSVFGTAFSRVSQVWTFNTSTQRFSGYDLTAIPQLKDLAAVSPGQGYWVNALETVTLVPSPYVSLPPDADASPLETEVLYQATDFPVNTNHTPYIGTQIRKVRPGSEDVSLDLNGNGILDSYLTQDTLLFDVGVDRKSITIGNNGTGVVNWQIINDVPWLYTAEPDAKTFPANVGRPKIAAGVVSSERDTVVLYADTTGLLPGNHTGTFTVYLGAVPKVITVKLTVPTSSGDWKGYATTQRVNGRSIGIGAVDMGINLFMTEGSSTEFRAVLNKDTSLLFPRDVFMNGVFYSGNQFSLTTNFEMPAGDRNAPPYDTFQKPSNYDSLTGSAKARADFDANSDKKLDTSNPFPFAVKREITLLGNRPHPNRLEGTYIESITGMLPNSQPIFVEGTFFLERKSFEPSKRSIFNQTTTNAPINIGGSTGTLYRETTINVASAVSVQGISLSLNVSFRDPTLLTITLIGPNGQVVTLHKNGKEIPATFDTTAFNGQLATGTWKLRVAWTPTGERGNFNSWGINIQGLATYSVIGKVAGNLGAGVVPLSGSHIVLSGSNVIQQSDTGPFSFITTTVDGSATATVSSTASLYVGMPITGNAAIPVGTTIAAVPSATTLTLSAAATANASSTATYGDAGVFKFTGLTENNYTLSISRPGFQTRLLSFFLNNNNLYIGETGAATTADALNTPVVLSPVTVSEVTLVAGPPFGQAPLFVNFNALIPIADLNAIGAIQSATWNFGDGTPALTDAASSIDDIAQTAAKHRYDAPGDYTAQLVLVGATGSRTVTTPIHVQRSAHDSSADAPGHQIIVAGYVGSFAAPLSDSGSVVQTSTITTVAQTLSVKQANGSYTNVALPSIARASVFQESKRDSASFDIDRSPLINPDASIVFSANSEDSDFDGQLYLSEAGLRTFPNLTSDERNSFAADNTPGTFATYVPPKVGEVLNPDRYRLFNTLGGSVFNIEPSKVGDLILQVGRVEP